MLDDALLLTTEVVTNAVKFSQAMITVVIECDGSSVAVAVADESAEPPQRQSPANDQLRGRGLQLVDLLATAWGWKPTSDRAGKVVWFRLGRMAPRVFNRTIYR